MPEAMSTSGLQGATTEAARTLGCPLLLLRVLPMHVGDDLHNGERPSAVDLGHLSRTFAAQDHRMHIQFHREERCTLLTCPVGSWNRMRNAQRLLVCVSAVAPLAGVMRVLGAPVAFGPPRLSSEWLEPRRSSTVKLGLQHNRQRQAASLWGCSLFLRQMTRAGVTARRTQAQLVRAAHRLQRSRHRLTYSMWARRSLARRAKSAARVALVSARLRRPHDRPAGRWESQYLVLGPPAQSHFHRPSLPAAHSTTQR